MFASDVCNNYCICFSCNDSVGHNVPDDADAYSNVNDTQGAGSSGQACCNNDAYNVSGVGNNGYVRNDEVYSNYDDGYIHNRNDEVYSTYDDDHTHNRNDGVCSDGHDLYSLPRCATGNRHNLCCQTLNPPDYLLQIKATN